MMQELSYSEFQQSQQLFPTMYFLDFKFVLFSTDLSHKNFFYAVWIQTLPVFNSDTARDLTTGQLGCNC